MQYTKNETFHHDYKTDCAQNECLSNQKYNINIKLCNDKAIYSKPVIVFTGGGTGGHIYPNLALIPEFGRRGYSAVYFGGAPSSPEARLAHDAGIEFFSIPTAKLIRSLSPSATKNNLLIPRTLSKAVKTAEEYLKKVHPAAVFSKGGYASLPTVLAAVKLGVPTFAHESDLTLGMANKLAAMKGATILKANPLSEFDGAHVGMPLREELFSCDKRAAMRELGIQDNGKPILLILGGSSGARFLNEQTEAALPALLSKYNVLHICGKNGNIVANSGDKIHISPNKTCDSAIVSNSNPSSAIRGDSGRGYYKRYEYCDKIWLLYAVSDVVISRAGATALYELSALKKKVLFVPLPKGISRGDQIDNAKLAETLGGQVLWQDKSFADKFLQSIEKTLALPPMKSVAVDANGKIADMICDTIRRGVS